MLEYAWIIPLLPLTGWVLMVFFGHRMKNGGDIFGPLSVGAAFVLSVPVLAQVIGGETINRSFTWLEIGKYHIEMGYAIDGLAAVLLTAISFVAFCIHLYSIGYMHGDVRYERYFANITLFTTGMLTLLVANNFLLFLIAWEIMGLCSYLLIGHWFEKKGPQDASMKAFITTRIGDVGLFIGIILLFSATGTFSFEKIFHAAEHGEIGGAFLTIAVLALFMGAVGKSAQFPLHVWLPDAMEGPTSVSALIHAATMVAAGVYLVARAFPLFHLSTTAMLVVAFIGAFTALFAATIATVMEDIKRVLAYSTISQLGYMMLALGVGGLTAGVFHLTTHAIFKALLFLGSGSVIHAVHTQNMHEMGGLLKKLPITGWTFLFGTAALAGLPPFAGFWSKDEILLDAFHSEYKILFWMGVAAAFLTAFYMTRLVILTFFGQPRDRHAYDHAHESPWTITVPLSLLAILSLTVGFVNSPYMGYRFTELVHFGHHTVPHSSFVQTVALISAFGGILVGWLIFGAGIISRRSIITGLRPAYVVIKNKYYVDEFYQLVIVRPVLALASLSGRFDLGVIDWIVNAVGWGTSQISRLSGWFDMAGVDGAVNGIANTTMASGAQLRKAQTGYIQQYLLALVGTMVVGLILFQFIGG